jgi:hypothetical protein
MLYASSRGSLISTLGLRTQKLSSQTSLSRKSELVFPKEDVPDVSKLSLRERELAEIKLAEAEGAYGTSVRRDIAGSSSGVAFPISEEAKAALEGLATGGEGGELVQLVPDIGSWADNSVSRRRCLNLGL